MSCLTEYNNRLRDRQQTYEQLRQCDDRAVHLRVATFVLGLICAWAVFGNWQLPGTLLLLPIGLFLAAIVYHESLNRKLRAVRRAIAYYKRCLDRLNGQWSGTGPTGTEFLEPQHPHAEDLDIFGTGSLFQLLNSPITPAGARTLAEWLAPSAQTPLPTPDAVVSRQDAVRNLRDQLDLRERLAVIGPASQPQSHTQELHQWLARAGGLTARWIRVVATLLGVLGVASLVIWLIGTSMSPLLLIVVVQLGFLRKLRQPLDEIKQHSEQAVVELRRIEQVVAALENVEGSDTELHRLRNELNRDGMRASEAIHRLERLVSQYENTRRNVFIAPLAFISMASFQLACSIDHWRAKHATKVEHWFQAIGELEALLAFAQLHFENPDYCFPQFVDNPPQFVATKLAHPLLPPGTAISNDLELSDNRRMLLVSGSNMSGKSTLLRSVGINTALAWAGAPVYAQNLKLSRLQVATAIRSQDSLQTGTSHFMANLQRIRLVVELAEQTTTAPVLFLLDEILHGTNSHDRLVGARGVIRSLLQAGAIGLVTTHDLALSDMVNQLDYATQNVHFRDEWRDGKMTFDYQMRKGVVPKSNALSLMRLLGLEV
ncbi:MAG: DNA mismatch repair protein MutS [Planctomycetes bacterium]|nr:DNA mismatch repair protein MutS [Planctomycetota bacterium]